jgi:phosphoglycolate phosphatase
MRPLIAFDLDGTLVDSARDLAESANLMLAEYGAAPLASLDVAGMVGDGAARLVARALKASGVQVRRSEALDRFLAIYAERMLVHTRPYAGVSEALTMAASRGSLAVLTNKPQALSRRLLDAFNLSRAFTWLVGGDGPFPRKPDPAGLLHLISAAGASPATTLMVGDSMIDVETARRAGAAVCVARYGFGHLRRAITIDGDDLMADGPHDLAGVIDQFLVRVGRDLSGSSPIPTRP